MRPVNAAGRRRQWCQFYSGILEAVGMNRGAGAPRKARGCDLRMLQDAGIHRVDFIPIIRSQWACQLR